MSDVVKGAFHVMAKGACADIIDLGGDRVLKAYRRKSHTEIVLDWSDHDAMTRAEFRAEVRAYEHLQAFPELKVYAPRYYGRIDPVQLLSAKLDASQKYVAGCGLIPEHIPGEPIKVRALNPSLQQSVEPVLERFSKGGGCLGQFMLHARDTSQVRGYRLRKLGQLCRVSNRAK